MEPACKRELEKCGVNVDYGIKTHMGNEKMYLKILKLVITDEKFDDLFDCADSGDAARIFELAHSLKGTVGNIGVDVLDELISDICETTRKGSTEGVKEKAYSARKLHHEIMQCIQ